MSSGLLKISLRQSGLYIQQSAGSGGSHCQLSLSLLSFFPLFGRGTGGEAFSVIALVCPPRVIVIPEGRACRKQAMEVGFGLRLLMAEDLSTGPV